MTAPEYPDVMAAIDGLAFELTTGRPRPDEVRTLYGFVVYARTTSEVQNLCMAAIMCNNPVGVQVHLDAARVAALAYEAKYPRA